VAYLSLLLVLLPWYHLVAALTDPLVDIAVVVIEPSYSALRITKLATSLIGSPIQIILPRENARVCHLMLVLEWVVLCTHVRNLGVVKHVSLLSWICCVQA